MIIVILILIIKQHHETAQKERLGNYLRLNVVKLAGYM